MDNICVNVHACMGRNGLWVEVTNLTPKSLAWFQESEAGHISLQAETSQPIPLSGMALCHNDTVLRMQGINLWDKVALQEFSSMPQLSGLHKLSMSTTHETCTYYIRVQER